MNKQLISMTAVAAMAGAALAVESKNVVGYQLIAVPTGYTLFTPTFEGIGTSLDLTTIEVVDANGDVLDLYNDVAVQKMDDAGYYLDGWGYSPTFGGWNIDLTTTIDEGDVTFANGESICVANESGDVVYFKVRGQVDLVNKNEIGTGFVLWGNSTPVEIDLTEITVVDANGDELDLYNDVAIQKMDDAGYYLDGWGYSPTFGGWNIDLTTPIEEGDVTLQPGEAVCVANESGQTVYFQLPHPIK